MTTYNTTKPFPYVYSCTHKDTGEFYIGYREGNKLPSTEDLPLYKTSSKTVNPNFHQYNFQILAEFFDGNSAYDFEQYLIYENWENPLLLNKSCFHEKKRFKGSCGMLNKTHSEITKKTMSEKAVGKKRFLGKKHSEETKLKMSEYHSNKKLSDEHKRKLSDNAKLKKHSDATKLKISESKKYARVCRLRDKKEMDIANFAKYP